MKGDDVVYVGRSINFLNRVGSHIKDKEFDNFIVLDVSQEYLDIVELFYILSLDPILNVNASSVPGVLRKDKLLELIESRDLWADSFDQEKSDFEGYASYRFYQFWIHPSHKHYTELKKITSFKPKDLFCEQIINLLKGENYE